MTDSYTIRERISLVLYLLLALVVGPVIVAFDFIEGGWGLGVDSARAWFRETFVVTPKEIITGKIDL